MKKRTGGGGMKQSLKLIDDYDSKVADKLRRDEGELHQEMQRILDQLKALNTTHARLRKAREQNESEGLRKLEILNRLRAMEFGSAKQGRDVRRKDDNYNRHQ